MEGSTNSLKLTSRLWRFSAVSLGVHLAFLFLSLEVHTDKPNSEHRTEKLVVKLLNNSSKSRQVVQTHASKKVNPPKDAQFLGKKNTNFERESKARKTGQHKAAGKGSRDAVANLPSQKRVQTKDKKVSFSDLGVKKMVRPKSVHHSNQRSNQAKKGLRNGKDTETGLARSSDFIEEVPLGDFTRLNTQEFKFYGFYHRIRQKLEQFWGAKLQEEMERLYRSGRTIASGRNLLTSLVIKMNSKGEIVHIQLNSTSGVQELDDVAITSFNEAGPFPNPPKNMLKDGVATIKWGFAVTSN